MSPKVLGIYIVGGQYFLQALEVIMTESTRCLKIEGGPGCLRDIRKYYERSKPVLQAPVLDFEGFQLQDARDNSVLSCYETSGIFATRSSESKAYTFGRLESTPPSPSHPSNVLVSTTNRSKYWASS